MPRLRPETVRQRRGAILDAALRLAVRHGLMACTMEDIAKEAGIAVGSLYTYFAGRSEIGVAVAERVFTGISEDLQGLATDDAALCPEAFVRSVQRLLSEYGVPAALMIQLYAEAAVNSEVREYVRNGMNQLAESYARLLRRRTGTKVLSDADALRLARGVQAVLQAWLIRSAVGLIDDAAEFEAEIGAVAEYWSGRRV